MRRSNILLIILLTYIGILFPLSSTAQQPVQSQYPPWFGEKETQDNKKPQTYGNALPLINDDIDFESKQEKLSAIEEIYAERLIDEPKQFGYDIFNQNNRIKTTNTPMGAVQDDFILSSGDELLITFTGQRTDQNTYKIDSRGMVIIKDIAPIPAMGRTIKQVRDSLNAALASMPNTQSYISLSSVKQINVLVVGDVYRPGRKTLNVFNSVLDALDSAGGIKKSGSLRQIKLVRGGRSTIIDLYALLLHGAPHIDMDLKDGDRLIIPPIGPTVAISGAVKRPGIYEIKKISNGINQYMHPVSEKLNLNAMLDLAGGVLTPNQNRFVMLSPSNNGQESVMEIQNPHEKLFGDGTILSVLSGKAKRHGKIELLGSVTRTGIYDLSKNKTLSSLLHSQDILSKDSYPLIGVIERWNPEQLTTEFLGFPVRSVLKKEFDLILNDNDSIRILSNQDISDIYTDDIIDTISTNITEQGSRFSDNNIIENKALISFLKERSVTIRGAVRKAGSYPIADGITLDNIIAVAGGLTLDADLNSIEISSKTSHKNPPNEHSKRTIISLNKIAPENYNIYAGDTIRINQKFDKIEENTVLIIGEVKRPGEYDLLAGDRISDLIERAGGLTAQAYPEGSIFSRETERKAEELRFRAAAQKMKSSLAKAMQREKNQPSATQIELVQALADELSKIEAVGRITVETNPDILSTKPELDMLLEKGDRLFIPKRPLTVRVTGEVLSPSALQFVSDKKPIDYIYQAGGFTYHADKDRAFVLYPNGSAQPLQVNRWNHKPIFIPPGSTIIVPRDPKPFNFIEGAKEIGQILGNLAVTSVFINNIRD